MCFPPSILFTPKYFFKGLLQAINFAWEGTCFEAVTTSLLSYTPSPAKAMGKLYLEMEKKEIVFYDYEKNAMKDTMEEADVKKIF